MALTVRKLIEDLQKLNPDQLVVLAKDGEGNDYSPLDSYSTGHYEAHSTWSGDVYGEEDVANGDAPDDLPEVVILWPTN